MKKTATLALLGLALYACQTDRFTTVDTHPQKPADIDGFIYKQLKTNGSFVWSAASDEMVWSALQQSDGVLSVGYKPNGQDADLSAVIHTIDVRSKAWTEARQTLLDLIFEQESRLNASLKRSDMEAAPEEKLPVMMVRVKNPETVRLLRRSPLVRYAEPVGYEPGQADRRAKTASSSGCGSNIADIPLSAPDDFASISPNAKSSWNHPAHGIRDAWAQSTGAGLKLVVIDTGLSPNQENLGSAFNQGSSSGRTIERLVTMPKAWPWSSPETPNDGCGHGTAMAGVAVGPRGTDGAAAGVAYNASLISIRAAADVLIDEWREVKGVSDAYVLAADRADVRVISLSLGRITSSSQITDAIRYAYNKGKLMYCAGGTSFGWTGGWWGVIFPAWLNEVHAVTGIRDNLTQQCKACHDGSKIDYVVVMEKVSNDRHPITLAMSGDAPSTVGGSSVATATTAGMAALLWARNPGWSRQQVIDRLNASSNYFPNRHPSFGWGRININTALTAQ